MNYDIYTLDITTVSKLCQGTNLYHLVRLYDDLTLAKLQSELDANAISIPHTASQYKYFTLTVTTTTYISHNSGGYLAPANSGATKYHKPITDEATITEDNHQYAILHQDYKTWYSTDRALKSLLVAAVPHIYLEELKHETLGYDNSTTLELLTHLWDIYGTIEKNILTLTLSNRCNSLL